jgi:hypothetical protein
LIEKPTVFVLGAGASHPYGFPTARGLLELPYASIGADSVLRQVLTGCGFLEDEILDFCRRLKRSGQDSIDLFLERAPRFLNVGKAAIAVQLLPQEFNQFAWDRSEDTDWCRYLFARMAPRNRADFGSNRLKIVTFNFDRSFEWRLARMLHGTYDGMTAEEATDLAASIGIVHIHGQLAGDPPSLAPDFTDTREHPPTAEEVLACIDQIRLSSEPAAGPQIDRAREWLQEAEVVCFLGFGFNTENLDKLNASSLGNKALHGTCKGMSSSDVTRAYNYFDSPSRTGYLLETTIRGFFDAVNVFSR